jgi:hypothetical protein
MLGLIKTKVAQFDALFRRVVALQHTVARVQQALGRIEARQLEDRDSRDLRDNEFQVFSQNGEDGILQFLVRHVPISRKIFVEFGVENYTESNTRFLLVNDNWAGLVLDGSPENVGYIRRDPIYWKHNLKAEQAFITRDNINTLFSANGVSGEIGILSIDIDGNDYWVWEAIDAVNPAIVVIEYNSRFGPRRAVTVPYDPQFQRTKAHFSNIYYGASLKALCQLGGRKGYAFVGCNTAGNNAFFVRKDVKLAEIRELSCEEGFVAAQFRESRDENGKLTFLSREDEIKLLSDLPLIEVDKQK